jgi:hypothetical protein
MGCHRLFWKCLSPSSTLLASLLSSALIVHFKNGFLTQGSPSWTLKDGADLDFDFVATSQPFEDGGEDLSWNRGCLSAAVRVDFVDTSQPLEDGEDFGLMVRLTTY